VTTTPAVASGTNCLCGIDSAINARARAGSIDNKPDDVKGAAIDRGHCTINNVGATIYRDSSVHHRGWSGFASI
jgi:hypothetical protein